MAIFSSKCLTGNPHTAAIIVAVGRGIQTEQCFKDAVLLAERLNAQLVGTRAACDNKWIKEDRIVGLSGLRIQPDIYLALGISGTNFHTMGMYNAHCVIAVNTDEKARITEIADYFIHKDAAAVIHYLLTHMPTQSDCSDKILLNNIREYIKICNM